MAFGIGTNTQKADHGSIRGRQEDIACGCWFTSKGNMLPKFIKYQDGEGMIHTITGIEVLYCEKQNFCGIPMVSYSCRTVQGEREYFFTLLYHLEECKWKIIWQA